MCIESSKSSDFNSGDHLNAPLPLAAIRYFNCAASLDSDDFVKAIKSEFDAKKVSNVIQKEEKLEEI